MIIYVHIYTHIYIYIGGWGVSPAGPLVTGKSFRVVPCVRTCVRIQWDFRQIVGRALSLFPFAPPVFPFSLLSRRLFPFPLWAYIPFSLVSTMKKWVQMRSSEFTWNQMESHDIKWNHMSSKKLNQMKSIELIWHQVNSNEIKWIQMKPNEFEWT